MSLAKYYEDNEEIMLERIRNREYNLMDYQAAKTKQTQSYGIKTAKDKEAK